jgi:hypothetical protein
MRPGRLGRRVLLAGRTDTGRRSGTACTHPCGGRRGFAGQVRSRRVSTGGPIRPSLILQGGGLCSGSAWPGPGRMRRPQHTSHTGTQCNAWCRCLNLEEKPRAQIGHPTSVPTWLHADLCSRSKSPAPGLVLTERLCLSHCARAAPAQPYTGGYVLRACAPEPSRRDGRRLRRGKGCRLSTHVAGHPVVWFIATLMDGSLAMEYGFRTPFCYKSCSVCHC